MQICLLLLSVYRKNMNVLRLFVNGFLIGIANIIPGMSGGTLALVLGIYERLIAALHNIGLSTVERLFNLVTLKKEAFAEVKAELRRIDFGFLALLGIGAIAAVLLTSKLIIYLLNNQHDATYGFFSGLILTSILIPARMLKGFGIKEALVLLIAVALIFGITIGGMGGQQSVEAAAAEEAVPASALDNNQFPSFLELTLFFGCGALAISAMILPGISGSFLMLAFGVYFPLLTAIKELMESIPALMNGTQTDSILGNLLILAFFAFGCLFGLVAFTRLLNYLLARYRNLTIAFLIGLMAGSLYGLWPFRAYMMVGEKRHDTAHLLPQLDMNLLITVGVFLIGCGVILAFSLLDKVDKEAE